MLSLRFLPRLSTKSISIYTTPLIGIRITLNLQQDMVALLLIAYRAARAKHRAAML